MSPIICCNPQASAWELQQIIEDMLHGYVVEDLNL